MVDREGEHQGSLHEWRWRYNLGVAMGLGFPGWNDAPFSYDCIMYFDVAVALPFPFDLVREATQGNNNHLRASQYQHI